MKISIFETEPWEARTFDQLSEEHEIRSTSGRLTEENIEEHREAEVISILIYSDAGEKILAKFPQLKMIATRSTGTDHIAQVLAFDVKPDRYWLEPPAAVSRITKRCWKPWRGERWPPPASMSSPRSRPFARKRNCCGAFSAGNTICRPFDRPYPAAPAQRHHHTAQRLQHPRGGAAHPGDDAGEY